LKINELLQINRSSYWNIPQLRNVTSYLDVTGFVRMFVIYNC
jgi:hypothetical protein